MSSKMFHYVLTIEIPGIGTATANEEVELPVGTSRQRVYRRAVELAVESMGQEARRDVSDRKPVTLFWSMEAADLGSE
ncbi:hypothetical protein [Streptomyces sp. NBRC 110465]|uniref:hypothetical protein n=1 Tax=Streptomyces sp. NBRC 110465 TaxID=1897621 RepID=UPI0009343892|nr:hypothetical protein [Streptomyces sp. NBRC 110465]